METHRCNEAEDFSNANKHWNLLTSIPTAVENPIFPGREPNKHLNLLTSIPTVRGMCRLTVLYGHPTDPAEFDRYYHAVHIPIARRMKGLQGWTIGKCESAAPGEMPPYYMIVGLYAESRAALEAIIASPEGQATIADVPKFATGGCTFLFNDETVLIPYALA